MRKQSCLFLALSLAILAGCATTAPMAKSPDEYLKEGDSLSERGFYEDAVSQWRKVKESYPSPEIAAQVELKIADAQFRNESYIEAAASYEDFRKLHPTHEKAPYTLYRLALCHYKQITGIDTDQTPVKNAVTYFDAFLKQYPTSDLAKDAQEKLDDCRQKQVTYEVYVGRFYLRTDKYEAAITRLENALNNFPDAPLHDETLYYLGTAYIKSGDKARGRDTFNRLFKQYQFSKYVEKAKKVMESDY
ncbi:MAG: outer membrane protein assembly factor BamD [Geobacter sp.]|nr:outer membrane protein assembly factor BamD [Geobacter sp.]